MMRSRKRAVAVVAKDREGNAQVLTARKSVRAIGLFAALLVGLEALYVVAYQSGPMLSLAQATAQATAWLLTLLGQSVYIDGATINGVGITAIIAVECTAITPTIVLAAAILAFPAPAWAKLKGLVLGIIGLYLVNLIRIVSLYYVNMLASDKTQFAHLVVWQAALVVITLGIWLFWAFRSYERQRI